MQKEQDVTIYLRQDLAVAGTLFFNLFECARLRVYVYTIHMLLEKRALKVWELELDRGLLLCECWKLNLVLLPDEQVL